MLSVESMYADGFKSGVEWAKRDMVKYCEYTNYVITRQRKSKLMRANELGFVRGYRSISR